MLISKKGSSHQGIYLLLFMLMLLVTEVTGVKFAGPGYAVAGMAIVTAGAFAASKFNQQVDLSFLLGAVFGLLGSLTGVGLCMKQAFAPAPTLVCSLLIVVIASVLAGDMLRCYQRESAQ